MNLSQAQSFTVPLGLSLVLLACVQVMQPPTFVSQRSLVESEMDSVRFLVCIPQSCRVIPVVMLSPVECIYVA